MIGRGVVPMKVLRLAHHAVVSAWRERERELRRLGIDVALISSKRWNEGGVEVHLQPDGDSFVQGAATIGRHPSVFLFNPVPIWRALGQRPDLIDLHEEPNALATAEVLFLRWLRRIRAPYVLYSAQNLEKRYPIPFRWIERHALRGAAAVYVCNREAGEISVRKGLRAPAVYIPLGVDIELFSPATREVPTTEKVLGYVGRLERHKGVDTLLRTLVGREEWRLRVIGDGPQRAELEALAEELGIAARVSFLGYAAGSALADRYRELDVIAVPSLPWPGWSEQFCRVAVEAMASGVPVVASATGAIPDVVAGAGLLVEPGDPAALARGIDAALETERWTQLRAAGLARSAVFTWARVAELQREMYLDVLTEEDDLRPIDPEVLIVAYGSPDQLDECLATLGAGLSVTVVDNSSLDQVQELAEAHGARYIDAARNRGFAGGVNLGLAAIAARAGAGMDVLLLNPDARIDQSSVRLMCRQLRRSARVAAIGALQTEPGSGKTVRVWWPFPTPWGAWIEAVGLGALRRQKDFAIGSILLLRGEAIDQVGMLDERFFLYAEETDWQRRARKLGWAIEVADVGATHEGAGTGGDPQKREAHFYGSAERYIRKHYGASGWQVYRAANIVGAALRGIVLPGTRGVVARRRRDIFLRGPIATERIWR